MVHGCMVYTKLAPRRLQFHVAPAMQRCKYTTSVDSKTKQNNNNNNNNNNNDKKLVTHVEPHASAVSLLKRVVNSAI